jgi:hypothetical protein
LCCRRAGRFALGFFSDSPYSILSPTSIYQVFVHTTMRKLTEKHGILVRASAYVISVAKDVPILARPALR